MPIDIGWGCWIVALTAGFGVVGTCQQGVGHPLDFVKYAPSPLYRCQGCAIRQIIALSVFALGMKQRGSGHQGQQLAIKAGKRICGNQFRRDVGIDNLINKAAVGPILKQPSYQLGQQITMRSNRRIDPVARCLACAGQIMHCCPPPMQALKLKTCAIRGQRNRSGAGYHVRDR